MKIYIDNEFKCYTTPGKGLTIAETGFFDDKAPDVVEGYRYIPAGQTWTRSDGVEFQGEMIAPWMDWDELDEAQREYEREQYTALTDQNDELVNTIAEMVEEVYESDLEVMEG